MYMRRQAYYIIRSTMTGYVLDIEGGGRIGARVIPWDRHGRDNQVWYDDPTTGTIRSKAGGLCLDIECEYPIRSPCSFPSYVISAKDPTVSHSKGLKQATHDSLFQSTQL